MAQSKTTRKRPRRATTRRARRRTVTPEDLLQYTYLSDPQISPDGTRIVFVHKTVGEKNEYVTNLWMVGSHGSDDPRPFTAGGKDRAPRWSPDGQQIAFVGARETSKPQLYLIGAHGGEAKALTTFPEGSMGSFRWAPNGKVLAVSFRAQDPDHTDESKKEREERGLSDPPRVVDTPWYRMDGDGYFGAQRYALYLVDASTGAHRKVYDKDALGFFTFDFSPDSRQVVISTNRDRRAVLKPWHDDLLRLHIATGKLTPIPNLPRGPKDQVRWSPDGRWIAYAGREGTDPTYSVENLQLYVCDPRTGRARSLTGRSDYCLLAAPITDTAEVAFSANLAWSPDSRRIFFQLGWHGESHVASVPRRGGPISVHTKGAADHTMGNISADGKMMSLTASRSDRLAEVFVGRIGAGQFRTEQVTALNRPLLSGLDLARPSSAWVRTADGTRVQVWVLKPPGFRAGRSYPAILEIHGGPHAQYGVGYFHEFQVLAAQGYVVFYANPRGSKGYGRDHCAAIRGDWGSADWTDLQAVIEYMKRQPFVNTRRMGVMGGSYGGYMTNWIVGHCHDFAGAITDRCVSNLVSMAGNSDFIDLPDDYFPGNFWDRPEARWDQSPIKYFGNVKTPMLIIHSEGDLRCNIEQAEQVFAALKLRNIRCRFVRYPRSSSHGMSRGGPPDLRVHRLRQILDWWSGCLKSKR